MKKTLLLATSALILGACSGEASSEGDAFPSENIEIVAPASPGGGWDLTARSLAKVLEDNELVEQPITVANKPGGGGEVGWQYLNGQDAHTLAVNSSLLITNNLLGSSELTHEDFTPLATLATEWQSVAVPADSEVDNVEELMEMINEDPSAVKIGVGPALGNDDHLSFVQAAREFGVDPKQLNFLVYEGGGDVLTALLGGHVDAVTTSLSEVKDQHLAGDVKVIAISSPERLPDIEDVPTYVEQGIPVEFPHWRGVMGPPDMTEEEIAYWDEKIGALVETEQWAELLDNNDWDSFYKDSAETAEFFEEQTELYESLVQDAGLGQ